MIIFGDYGYSYTYTTEATDFVSISINLNAILHSSFNISLLLKNPKVVEARAVRRYQAPPGNAEYLSFEKGVMITNVVVGEEGGFWTGDLGSEKQKKFPSDCVEIIQNDSKATGQSCELLEICCLQVVKLAATLVRLRLL